MKSFLVSLFIIFALGAGADDSTIPGFQATDLINSEAPPLELHTWGGNALPEKRFRGKPRIVAFLALNVSEGHDLVKQLDKVRRSFGPDQLEVIVVEIARNKEKVRSLSQNENITIDIFLCDSKQLMQDWRIHYMPTIFIIDSNDVIREVIEQKKQFTAEQISRKALGVINQ